MTKPTSKSNRLPRLQRGIVLHLAKSKPQTINETATALSKSYKPAWVAFGSLEKKKLIRKAGMKEYRSRKFPAYWLTDEGIVTAMLEGANRTFLLKESKRLFPDAKILHCFLEVIQHMNPMMMQLAGNVIKNKGTMDFADLMTILISDTNYEIDAEIMKKIVAVLKKYPAEYEQAKILIQQMIEKLSQLISD
jgi:hypothetical protein